MYSKKKFGVVFSGSLVVNGTCNCFHPDKAVILL